MKIRVAITGLLISLAVALPVVAGGLRNNLKANATAVAYYEYEFGPDGMYTRWNQNRGWTLTFGDAIASDYLEMGLRIDCPASQAATSFQFDVNTCNANLPYLEIWAVIPGKTGPQLVGSGSLCDASCENGFTFTNLGNGFTRVNFNAANYGLPSGASFSSLYYADFNFGCTSFQDQITNAIVNGRNVPANIQSKPEFDSTLDFDD